MRSISRLLLLAVALFLISSPVHSAPEKKKKVKVYFAWVTYNDHTKIKGVFREVGDSSVTVFSKEQFVVVPAASIKKIVFRRKASAGRGALIGAASGLVVGAVVGYVDGSSDEYFISAEDEAVMGAIVASGFGALIGTIIGTIPRKQVNIGGNQQAFEKNRELLRRFSLSDAD
ncbi:MAG: glycine zipper family protein [Chryseolinea sp.]